ncbi:MAG TPA: Nif3-like dinuclear metal center hexameric protein [Rubricoccaceae bacterium]|nr:Nif3-like dinuclear metal center hexameric protein [Rubricoccaceae bacterium]
MPTVRDLAATLEAWAPPGQKLDYDHVGLQVGDASAAVERVLVALDLTPAVVDEAAELKADLVITHHPLLFRPLQRLTTDDPAGALALRLAQAGIAYYALHTNLDAAPGGVSFALAEHLGLEGVRSLEPTEGALKKLVTFVPATHAEAVRRALADAGAGRIGAYEGCTFEVTGTGRFRPTDAARPFIGEAGGPEETVEEVRLEMEVMKWDVARAVAALKAAHPYEEVAYDLYPVEQAATRAGFGAVGTLPEAVPLRGFLAHVAERLDAGALRYAGHPDASVRTVAVCGGAGASLLKHALRVGADAYVTADVSYHRFFEALAPDGMPRIALIDAGHYETEALTERLLTHWLAARFPGLTVTTTRHRTSPMRTYVRNGGRP